MENIVSVAALIGKELRSRTEAESIYDSVKNVASNHILLDFSHISFMSRSFADELCEVVEKLEKEGKQIASVYDDESIEIAVDIVHTNRRKPKQIKTNATTVELQTMKKLSDFLATV